jgi:hypothetical protein
MLEALLLSVMATLAQGLEGTSPELHHITAMRLDMVIDQQRGVAFDAAAFCTLTGVEIAPEDLQAQLLPACRLVQGTARIIATTAPISCPLLFGCSWNGQRRPNGTEPGLDETDLRHVQLNKKPLILGRWRLLNVISVCERIYPRRQASAAPQFEFVCRPPSRQMYSASHSPLRGESGSVTLSARSIAEKHLNRLSS